MCRVLFVLSFFRLVSNNQTFFIFSRVLAIGLFITIFYKNSIMWFVYVILLTKVLLHYIQKENYEKIIQCRQTYNFIYKQNQNTNENSVFKN